jgi:hypothetical protein
VTAAAAAVADVCAAAAFDNDLLSDPAAASALTAGCVLRGIANANFLYKTLSSRPSFRLHSFEQVGTAGAAGGAAEDTVHRPSRLISYSVQLMHLMKQHHQHDLAPSVSLAIELVQVSLLLLGRA